MERKGQTPPEQKFWLRPCLKIVKNKICILRKCSLQLNDQNYNNNNITSEQYADNRTALKSSTVTFCFCRYRSPARRCSRLRVQSLWLQCP